MMPIGRPRTCDCGVCRKCRYRDKHREWYQRQSPEYKSEAVAKRDPEKVQATKTRHQQSPKGRAMQERNRLRMRAIYPEKTKARTAVSHALRDKRLFRQPCEVCGATKVQAHHDDYSKPLEVRWMCQSHHWAHHHRGQDGFD